MRDLGRLDVNLIGVLEAVLTERNITRAGERLGLTQPAVSNSVARLRAHFADPLIVRKGRGFELTPFAERLLPLVHRAMAEVSRTLEYMPSFDPATTRRTFYVSGSDLSLSELGGPLQSLLREHAPNAKVSFDSLPLSGLVDPAYLLRRDLLIASSEARLPGRHCALFTDRIVCIASRDHPRLRRRDFFDTDDIAELRFALNRLHGHHLTPVDDLLSLAGITPRPGIAVQGFLPLPWMITGTELIAYVPERIALRYMRSLGLRIVDTPFSAKAFTETAYWHPSRDRDPARQWLLAQLQRAARITDHRLPGTRSRVTVSSPR